MLPTLIIADMWFCPAPCDGKLRAAPNSVVQTFLFSIRRLKSARISGVSSLIIMPHLIQCALTQTCMRARKAHSAHTQTTSGQSRTVIKGNSLIWVIKEGIIESSLNRDNNWGELLFCLNKHTHTHALTRHIPTNNRSTASITLKNEKGVNLFGRIK